MTKFVNLILSVGAVLPTLFVAYGQTECRKEIVDPLRAYELTEVMKIDELDEDTYIVTAHSNAKGSGTARTYLVARENGGDFKGSMLKASHFVSFVNIGRYTKVNGTIYRIRNERKGGITQLFNDRLDGTEFIEPKEPFLEFECEHHDLHFANERIYVESLESTGEEPEIKGGIKRIPVREVVFSVDATTFSLISRIDVEHRLEGEQQYNRFFVVNGELIDTKIFKVQEDDEDEQIVLSIFAFSDNDYVQNSYTLDFEFDFRTLISGYWHQGKFFAIMDDEDLNVYAVLIEEKDGKCEVISQSNISYANVVRDYPKNEEGNVNPDYWKRLLDNLYIDNFVFTDGDDSYLVTALFKIGADGWKITGDCFIARVTDNKVLWVTNIARGWHASNSDHVPNVLDNPEKNALPQISFTSDKLIFEEKEGAVHFEGEVFRKAAVTSGFNRKLYDNRVEIDKNTGAFQRSVKVADQ